MSLVRLCCTKREDLKGQVVMGILDPVTKKLSHPQPKMVLSRIDVFNPRARNRWNAPPEKPPQYYGLLCTNDAQLYGPCSWLSKCSLCHPLLHLTRIPSQFSFLWVGNLVSIPNSLGMGLVGQT